MVKLDAAPEQLTIAKWRSVGHQLLALSVVMVIAAWLVFVVSFFLPATNVVATAGNMSGAPLTGWQAFTTSLSSLLLPWAWFVEPRVFLFLAFPIANGLMLFSPTITLVMRGSSAVLTLILVPFAILPWFMPTNLMGDLFVGFYCWNGSFLGMGLACALMSVAYAKIDSELYDAYSAQIATRVSESR